MNRLDRYERVLLWWALGVAVLLVGLMIVVVHVAEARDLDGRYAQSEHHDWVKSLHSPAGMWCCDISDGRALVDADWRSQGDHYQVRLREDWIDVPGDAVIGQPNKIGQTVVWFGYRDGKAIVNCFLPGSMT